MPRYSISESVGSRILPVHSFEDLHKHHPSSGRESGRDYGTIDGQFEEIRNVQGHTFIKKDFILSSDAAGPVEVPAPASGYAHFLNDPWNTVQIYDKPFGTPGAQREAQVLHMVRDSSSFREGAKVEYGQALGQMGDTGTPGSIHVHVEAELGQFQQYIHDIDKGVIRPGVVPAAGIDHGGTVRSSLLINGDQGADVRAMQGQLGQLGYKDGQGNPLQGDGKFGPNTQHAVEAFQRDHKLSVDGKAGPRTLEALAQAVQIQSVRHRQGELDKLGYKDSQAHALKADGDFGHCFPVAVPKTGGALDHALKDSQAHALKADGDFGHCFPVAVPQTGGALDHALKAQTSQTALMLDDPRNPDHPLYQQALAGVQKIDAHMGRPSDDHSIRLAASLVAVAKANGLTRIDAVALSEDGSRTFVVQNTAPAKTLAQLDTATAVATPIEKSSAAAQAAQPTTQLVNGTTPSHDQSLAQPAQTSQHAAAGPSLMA
jgi:hypothetical protein